LAKNGTDRILITNSTIYSDKHSNIPTSLSINVSVLELINTAINVQVLSIHVDGLSMENVSLNQLPYTIHKLKQWDKFDIIAETIVKWHRLTAVVCEIHF
jgi:hypothetical protein